ACAFHGGLRAPGRAPASRAGGSGRAVHVPGRHGQAPHALRLAAPCRGEGDGVPLRAGQRRVGLLLDRQGPRLRSLRRGGQAHPRARGELRVSPDRTVTPLCCGCNPAPARAPEFGTLSGFRLAPCGPPPMENNKVPIVPPKGPWPEPRVRALQVEELYRFAPMATGFSYFGALLTLGVLIEIGDIGRGAIWFLWATAVTFFRSICIVAYRRRGTASHPDGWANLVIAANLLAGIQWGILGTLLFPEGAVYLQLFTLMVIICFVAGSVP